MQSARGAKNFTQAANDFSQPADKGSWFPPTRYFKIDVHGLAEFIEIERYIYIYKTMLLLFMMIYINRLNESYPTCDGQGFYGVMIEMQSRNAFAML